MIWYFYDFSSYSSFKYDCEGFSVSVNRSKIFDPDYLLIAARPLRTVFHSKSRLQSSQSTGTQVFFF